MTIAFWVLAANLTIVALLIIVVPIWFRRDVNIDDNEQHNLDIGRQKLTELKSQRDQQVLSQVEYEEQLTELELALDDELGQAQNSKAKVSQGRWVVALIVPLLPISAIAIYLSVGAPQMLDVPAPPAQATATSTATPANPSQTDLNTMIAKLEARLKQTPDDIKGWLMLGRTNMYTKAYAKAVDAFAQADKLQADDPNILIQYADALAMANDGRMDGKPNEMVFRALALDPINTKGLWLAGMAKAEQGEFQAALDYWLKLQPMIAGDAQSAAEVQELIAQVRGRMGQSAPASQPVQIPVTNKQLTNLGAGPALTIQVTLSADLQKQAAPTDTVFIYAQALQGMRMPLAIVRKQVKDLPLTVTLTDVLAMAPMAKLSNNKQVKILARVSKAGSAMPQPGDLLGVVEPVMVSETDTIQVVISRFIE